MTHCFSAFACRISFVCCVWSATLVQAQLNVTSFTPVRHGLTAHVDAPIRIDFDRPLDPTTINTNSLGVFGRWTGVNAGDIQFENANRTLVVHPSTPFTAGDLVTVNLSENVMAADGTPLQTGGFTFQYWTRSQRVRDLSYSHLETIPVGNPSRPYGGVASDLNEDGWMDITLVNEDSADLRIFMNQADGTGRFDDFMQPTTSIGNRASPSESADFNKDGHIDIAVVNINDDSVSVVLGNGDGTFKPQQTIPVGDHPRGIATLDVDGDGDTDIVNTNRFSGNLSVHINNGNGVFGTPTTIDGGVSQEWSLMAGDMNNDGLLDLVTASGIANPGSGGNAIRVMTSNGDGTFTQQPTQVTGGASWQIMLGDVNGDGNLDISSANAQSNNGAILLGNGDGTLASPTTYNIPNMGNGGNGFPLATDLGDLDGDGDLDWMTSSFNGDFIMLENDGSGNFTFNSELGAPDAASCALMVDFDNDGDLDLALIDELDNLLILQRNDGTPVADGDFDMDGDLDVGDLDQLTNAIADASNRAYFDLDGDGVVGIADLDRWLMLGGEMNLASESPYLYGDANLDGAVDVTDFNIWNSNKFTQSARWSAGNFNGDNSVDVSDFNRWNVNKFQSSDVQQVPEPQISPWLCLLMLSGLNRRVLKC